MLDIIHFHGGADGNFETTRLERILLSISSDYNVRHDLLYSQHFVAHGQQVDLTTYAMYCGQCQTSGHVGYIDHRL